MSLMIAEINLCDFSKLWNFLSVGTALRIFQSWKSNIGKEPEWSDSLILGLNYLQEYKFFM